MNRAILTGTHVMMGNHAMIEGAIAAGCRFFAGYPITPQNEVPERMSERMPEAGGTFIQMEDEIGSIAACIGASLAGVKAMTSSSGPGISLKQECISWAASVEIPLVIANVQRTGPGSGIVSLPHHGDMMQARFGGNGDYQVITIAPASSQELFDMMIDAFNYAELWRVPVIVMSDAFLGHILEKIVIPTEDEINKRVVQRRQPTGEPGRLIPFTYESQGQLVVPPPPVMGTKYFPAWVPSVTHNERGIPILDERGSFKMVQRLCDKILKNEDKIVKTESYYLDDADVVVVAYGLPFRTSLRAVRDARKKGIKAGLLRLVTVWPFANNAVSKAVEGKKAVIVPEINFGQVFIEIERAAAKKCVPAYLIPQISKLHEPKEVLSKIEEVAK